MRSGFELFETFAHFGKFFGVSGIVDEVVFLMGIIFEVEELLDLVLGVVEVFVILSNERFGGGDAVGVRDGGVLVVKFGSPGGRCVREIERGNIGALHGLRSLDASGGEDGGGEVDVEGEVIVGGAVFALGHAGVVDDKRDADAFLVGIPFVGEAVFGMIVAVVGGEDHEGVLEDALLFEGCENFSANCVDFGGETVVVLHHGLILFRSVETPVVANASFVFIAEEVGELFPRFFCSVCGHGDGDVLIELHAFRLGAELIGMTVLRVGGEESEGETEGLVLGALAQEIEGVVFVPFGDVNLSTLAIIIPVLAGVRLSVVEFFGWKFPVMPFPDLADVVAIGPEQGGVGFGEGSLPGFEISAAVAGHPLAGKEGSSTDAAD